MEVCLGLWKANWQVQTEWCWKAQECEGNPKDLVRKEVAKQFEKYEYYRQLEIRNQKNDTRQKWIEKKKLKIRGITIETEDVGPPMDSVSASTLEV